MTAGLATLELIEQDGFLMDGCYTVSGGCLRNWKWCRRVINQDLPAIGLIRTRQHLDQCRFACAVMTKQAHDFAGMQIDRHVVDRLDPAERDRHVAHFYKWCGHLSDPPCACDR